MEFLKELRESIALSSMWLELSLSFLEGMSVVTSGLGNLYPKGLRIGGTELKEKVTKLPNISKLNQVLNSTASEIMVLTGGEQNARVTEWQARTANQIWRKNLRNSNKGYDYTLF